MSATTDLQLFLFLFWLWLAIGLLVFPSLVNIISNFVGQFGQSTEILLVLFKNLKSHLLLSTFAFFLRGTSISSFSTIGSFSAFSGLTSGPAKSSSVVKMSNFFCFLCFRDFFGRGWSWIVTCSIPVSSSLLFCSESSSTSRISLRRFSARSRT